MKNYGFTLLEVIFAIAFLLMISMAIISLDLIGLKMMDRSEVKTLAYGLNDENIGFSDFCWQNSTNNISGCGLVPTNQSQLTGFDAAPTYYIDCKEDVTKDCQLTGSKMSITAGKNRQPFTREIKFYRDSLSNLNMLYSKISWGAGDANMVEFRKVLSQ